MKATHYFVEGECEKKFIDEYKAGNNAAFYPGKVEVFNFINKRITLARLGSISKNTQIILVYDTDVLDDAMMLENIGFLKSKGFKNILHIQSIKKFEDELVYSTSLKNINEMFNTDSTNEFKNKFIKANNLKGKLLKLNFNAAKIWSRKNDAEPFEKYYSKNAQEYLHNNRWNI